MAVRSLLSYPTLSHKPNSLASGTRVRYQGAIYVVIGNAERGKLLIQNYDDAEDIVRVEEGVLTVV
ncbi:hypothetical protein BJX66DRAFT_332346 [Aspergillus keveii]|uniref:Uncharacterized protein n=1 Tax=Aspergillus keveii TaxID=714993 RepID=A0ABR4GME2_9EURO